MKAVCGYLSHAAERSLADLLPLFRRPFDRNCYRVIRGEGIMRQPVLLRVLVSCALLFFIASFGSVYISFRASAPYIRGLVGGGFFLLASLLLLWKDLVPVALTKMLFEPAVRREDSSRVRFPRWP
jgi:hypothetical protein